jgi:hypothetical protein
MPTTTITFGEVAENGPGMQQLGVKAAAGLSYEELVRAKHAFEAAGYRCELIDLISAAGVEELGPEPAFVLIVRGGVAAFAPPDALAAELRQLVPDKKAIFRGEVKNKLARWNLTFGDEAQEPDYEKGRGTIVPFATVPTLAAVRERPRSSARKRSDFYLSRTITTLRPAVWVFMAISSVESLSRSDSVIACRCTTSGSSDSNQLVSVWRSYFTAWMHMP